MCDSRRPLNGADSDEGLGLNPGEGWYLPAPLTYPVWPTRAVFEGWDAPRHHDTPGTPASARALVGAGARGGE